MASNTTALAVMGGIAIGAIVAWKYIFPSEINPPCTPNCTGKECGSDGCSGSCGTCPTGETCQNGVCVGGGGQAVDITGLTYS